MKNKLIFWTLTLGLLFANLTILGQAKPDPSEKMPEMHLLPTAKDAHKSGKNLRPEYVHNLYLTGEHSNSPLTALQFSEVYRLEQLDATIHNNFPQYQDQSFRDVLGNDETTWSKKLHQSPEVYFKAFAPGEDDMIWSYGWLSQNFKADNDKTFEAGWYYSKIPPRRVGDKLNGGLPYTENEYILYLDLHVLYPNIPEFSGDDNPARYLAWTLMGCGNPCMPAELPFKDFVQPKDPVAENKTYQQPVVYQTQAVVEYVPVYVGSNWVVQQQVGFGVGWSIGFSVGCQPAPMWYSYCGSVGYNPCGYNYCPTFQPLPQYTYVNNNYEYITNNYYAGDTYNYNIFEGDTNIFEGDTYYVYNPEPDPEPEPEGTPILGENGDGDPNPDPPKPEGTPVLAENGPNLGNNGDGSGGDGNTGGGDDGEGGKGEGGVLGGGIAAEDEFRSSPDDLVGLSELDLIGSSNKEEKPDSKPEVAAMSTNNTTSFVDGSVVGMTVGNSTSTITEEVAEIPSVKKPDSFKPLVGINELLQSESFMAELLADRQNEIEEVNSLGKLPSKVPGQSQSASMVFDKPSTNQATPSHSTNTLWNQNPPSEQPETLSSRQPQAVNPKAPGGSQPAIVPDRSPTRTEVPLSPVDRIPGSGGNTNPMETLNTRPMEVVSPPRQPTKQPAMMDQRPSTRPVTTVPSTRPADKQPATQPSTRPTTPSRPITTTRPSTRPVTTGKPTTGQPTVSPVGSSGGSPQRTSGSKGGGTRTTRSR